MKQGYLILMLILFCLYKSQSQSSTLAVTKDVTFDYANGQIVWNGRGGVIPCLEPFNLKIINTETDVIGATVTIYESEGWDVKTSKQSEAQAARLENIAAPYINSYVMSSRKHCRKHCKKKRQEEVLDSLSILITSKKKREYTIYAKQGGDLSVIVDSLSFRRYYYLDIQVRKKENMSKAHITSSTITNTASETTVTNVNNSTNTVSIKTTSITSATIDSTNAAINSTSTISISTTTINIGSTGTKGNAPGTNDTNRVSTNTTTVITSTNNINSTAKKNTNPVQVYSTALSKELVYFELFAAVGDIAFGNSFKHDSKWTHNLAIATGLKFRYWPTSNNAAYNRPSSLYGLKSHLSFVVAAVLNDLKYQSTNVKGTAITIKPLLGFNIEAKNVGITIGAVFGNQDVQSNLNNLSSPVVGIWAGVSVSLAVFQAFRSSIPLISALPSGGSNAQ